MGVHDQDVQGIEVFERGFLDGPTLTPEHLRKAPVFIYPDDDIFPAGTAPSYAVFQEGSRVVPPGGEITTVPEGDDPSPTETGRDHEGVADLS
jgi:hypothetical protein